MADKRSTDLWVEGMIKLLEDSLDLCEKLLATKPNNLFERETLLRKIARAENLLEKMRKRRQRMEESRPKAWQFTIRPKAGKLSMN
jgi:hypothetical protein